jgi:hypothetical protein
VTEPEALPAAAQPAVRSTLVYLAVLVALALLVAGVWGFGGFKKRTDTLRPVPPGERFTSGPYEFSFSEATVQRTKLDGVISWKVKVLGQGRTTGKEAIRASTACSSSRTPAPARSWHRTASSTA